ncbi:MAG TPA: hypothetical protein VG889_14415 [Rhizomicrobium sp.]|nr:hypothetical protein [Rhizomicrobium sp.]
MDRKISLAPWIAALLCFAAVAFAPQIFNDGDTYWHIAAGARMIADRAVLYADPFSYTFAGHAWNAHEWLSEVLMAAAFRLGGWGGTALLFAAGFALAAGLLARDLGRWFAEPARTIVLVLALSCMTGSLLARPHILALPLLEIWTVGLVIAREEKRSPSVALLPVMTLWANLHGGFVFGFLLAGLMGLEALAEAPSWKTFKSWALFGVFALIAALITPHFVDGLLFPFRLVQMSGLGHVGEWQPTSFATIEPFELVVLAGLYVLLSRRIALPVSRILIVLLLLHLALQHQRHQIVFAMTVPLLLAAPIARALDMRPGQAKRSWVAIAAAMTALAGIAFARLSLALPHGGALVTPEAALAHVPRDVAATPVLNEYGFGGYLIFRGVKPFIDSRAELYGDDFLKNYARIMTPDPKALQATLAQYRIGWTLLIPDTPAAAAMDLMPGWKRLYADDIAVVHVRNR